VDKRKWEVGKGEHKIRESEKEKVAKKVVAGSLQVAQTGVKKGRGECQKQIHRVSVLKKESQKWQGGDLGNQNFVGVE